ncbi:hypothetical protein [Psychrobacter sp. I-STPA6b]|uniref:HvfA family oxazolone/thioamide-modified RiPP metallophore n=1 Tax=Psychrobacter sp. I-STPA6b TaxID=2585718 RepID=UPI001D0C6950|nr:hypothetical protein [Psychrobacter sp. I-STPA6b]
MNKKSILTSLALGSLVTLSGCANNPFSAEPMQNGYQNNSTAPEGKCGEAKCGANGNKVVDGSCSANKMADGSCGANKMADGSCGANKMADGSCGASH